MGFNAPTSDEQRSPSLLLESADDVNGKQPLFVGVPPGDLAKHSPMSQPHAKCRHGVPFRQDQGLCREAVWDDERIYSPALHQLLHIAAHCCDNGCLGQPTPSDAVKGKGVIGIPQNGYLIPYPCRA